MKTTIYIDKNFKYIKSATNQVTKPLFQKMNSYEMDFYKILSVLYPSVPINAAISGDRSTGGAVRVERDVIRHQPNLTIVCYGLNDCSENEDSIKTMIFSK